MSVFSFSLRRNFWPNVDIHESNKHFREHSSTENLTTKPATNNNKNAGWLHHLARHSVACFLTRGDLWLSWEAGRDVFNKYLIDGDFALNNANWMWLSGSSIMFSSYFRVYSPISFAKAGDPTGKYIRFFLPALKHFPDAYIYEPWKAPLDVQKRAGNV